MNSPTWLEDTLRRSQDRFQKLPQWLQESAWNEEFIRRAEAMELYKGSEQPSLPKEPPQEDSTKH